MRTQKVTIKRGTNLKVDYPKESYQKGDYPKEHYKQSATRANTSARAALFYECSKGDYPKDSYHLEQQFDVAAAPRHDLETDQPGLAQRREGLVSEFGGIAFIVRQ